jgi:hypothetical protein
VLRLADLRMFPMPDCVVDSAVESADDAVSVELFASPYLSDPCELTFGGTSSVLDCVFCFTFPTPVQAVDVVAGLASLRDETGAFASSTVAPALYRLLSFCYLSYHIP